MIEFKDITKIYNAGTESAYEALKGINFKINSGELFGIIGPSGAGKTTIMNIIGLLDKPSTGKYYLDDLDTTTFTGDKLASLRNRRLGFVFQQYNLLPKFTALENVILPLTYRRIEPFTRDEMKKRAMEMLDRVQMSKYATHKPLELSGGQQQRISIARALVGEPSLILADEPTGALDTETTAQIMKLLEEQMSVSGTTVVIVTHNPEIAAQCQRSVHILDGMVKSTSAV